MTKTPWHTRFRGSAEERALVVSEQAVCAAAGIDVSLNDVMRHLLRRSGISPACGVTEARDRLLQHWAECGTCERNVSIRCIDGLWLKRDWRRLYNAGLTPDPDAGSRVYEPVDDPSTGSSQKAA
jgi:hypothetical protein